MKIEYNCRICKQPRSFQVDDDTPQVWINKLHPMLTCNVCYDRRQRFVRATTIIIDSCWQLHVVRGSGDADKVARITPKVRDVLMRQTRAYAVVMAEFRSLPNYVWSEDWIGDFMQSPDEANQILRNYRSALRNYRIEPELIAVTNDP